MGSSQSCPPSLTAEQEGRRRRQRPERRCRMEGLAAERRKAPVFLGVDTHSEAHVGVVVDGTGRRLGALTVPNSEAGYVELVGWVIGFGALVAAGVEGTGSYGAGLSRFLRVRGASVMEVNRTSRQHRRRHGKHDAADAEAAAPRAVMAGTASGEPKGADGAAESLRALRSVARRYRALSEEIAELDARIERLAREAAPALVALDGVGPDTAAALLIAAGDNPDRLRSEASFAHLCGAAPVQASSGKVLRHRLNPGGNRDANRALHVVALNRLRRDPRTRGYVARRTTEGKSKREAMRCLKRYIARETYRAILLDAGTR